MRTRAHTFRCFALLLTACALGAAPPDPPNASTAPRVQCLRVGQGAVTGQLLSIREGKVALLRDGTEEGFPLEAFREIVLETSPRRAAAAAFGAGHRFRLWTDEGSLLLVREVREEEQPHMLHLTGAGWEAGGVAVSSLRALLTANSGPGGDRDLLRDLSDDFQKARNDPPVGSDRVMLLKDGRRVAVTCAVERITQSGVTVTVGGTQSRPSRIPWSDVAWLVLGRAGGAPARDEPGRGGADGEAHLLEMADGSRIRLQSLALANGALTGEYGPARYSIQAEGLRKIIVASDAYRYLSDLQSEQVELRPLLDVVWQPQFDRSVAGPASGGLLLGGQTYAKGIGMHTYTAMTFNIGGRYSRFFAMIGVDDAAGDRGRVIFRVLADGRQLLTTQCIRGRDPPNAIALDIGKAQTLTLVADFGSPVGASGNFADWADARVVK